MYGYIAYKEFIVNLDYGIPKPFFKRYIKLNKGEDKSNDDQFDIVKMNSANHGYKMTKAELICMDDCALYTPFTYQDIFMEEQYSGKIDDIISIEQCIFYLNRHTIIFEYLTDPEGLDVIFDLLEQKPLYFCMILLRNTQGNTPLDIAIAFNLPAIVDRMLSKIMNLHQYNVS